MPFSAVPRVRSLWRRLARARRGAALIEFALLLPALVMLVWGMLAYGQYLMLAHDLQQVANDAARATVAGLSPDERHDLAERVVLAELARLPAIDGSRAEVEEREADVTVTVIVRYDAGTLPVFRRGPVPLPSAVIERRAVVRVGGFV